LNGKALFVQQGAVLAPKLDPPAARAFAFHGVAAIRAVTGGWIGLNAEFYRVVQAVVPVPTMLDRGDACGFDLSVEEQRARRDRTVWRIASPLFQVGAEPCSDY
jgi:hypothetical protein